MYLYGAGGHSKFTEIYWKVWAIYSIFDDNQCVGKRQKKRDTFGRKYLSVLESPVMVIIMRGQKLQNY
jgi:hypothetical protein